MREIWEQIKGYENYAISSLGRVKNTKTGRMLKQVLEKDGYCIVCLSKCGKSKQYRVHRLVAEHFIDNPECKLEVNHINGNKSDNRVDNLEWCTNCENITHAVCVLGTHIMKPKPIRCIETQKVYSSVEEAERIIGATRSHISRCNISHCLTGKQHTAYGCHWEYVNDESMK